MRQKLLYTSKDAGADYYVGSYAAFVWLPVGSCAQRRAVCDQSATNEYGAKVAMHEYLHVLQKAFHGKMITSTTPISSDPGNLGTNRFKVYSKAPASTQIGGVALSEFTTKIQKVMDNV